MLARRNRHRQRPRLYLSCSFLALGLGLGHALYVYRQEIGEFRIVLTRYPVIIRLRAGYYAAWTLMLWLLLGTTVVVYWAMAIVPYLIAKSIRNAGTARATTGLDGGTSP